jgi:hypothetical protein
VGFQALEERLQDGAVCELARIDVHQFSLYDDYL